MESRVQLMHLAGAADGAGTRLGPCSMLLAIAENVWPAVELLAIGSAEEVSSHPATRRDGLITLEALDRVAIPGLVNVHTHLDLTHIGPQPFPRHASFVDWVDMVRAGRVTDSEAIRASVHDGASRALAGGVVAVGDIAGVFGVATLRAVAETPLAGLVGIELFGIGRRQRTVIGMLNDLQTAAEEATVDSDRLEWTWQPHAPYSVGPDLYREAAMRCAERQVPMMTHLAETAEEHRFVAFGDGLQREMLERLGAWDETCADSVGKHTSPIQHLSEILARAPSVAAHVNAASDADLQVLAETSTTVAYCPRASAYFRQQEVFGTHRYREMLDLGINVALGTDSVINIPADQSDRLSTLDEARLLVRRDGLEPEMALGMATWRGAKALNLDLNAFSFRPAGLPRRLNGVNLVAVDPGDGNASDLVMSSEHLPCLVRLNRASAGGRS